MSTTTAEILHHAARSPGTENLATYYILFFFSGFPALLYQIVWQRALFTFVWRE